MNARRLRFRLVGSPADYLPGEQRRYDVIADGVTVGVCDADYLPHPTRPGEVVDGFAFTDAHGRTGTGRTRAAAVADAYADGSDR